MSNIAQVVQHWSNGKWKLKRQCAWTVTPSARKECTATEVWSWWGWRSQWNIPYTLFAHFKIFLEDPLIQQWAKKIDINTFQSLPLLVKYGSRHHVKYTAKLLRNINDITYIRLHIRRLLAQHGFTAPKNFNLFGLAPSCCKLFWHDVNETEAFKLSSSNAMNDATKAAAILFVSIGITMFFVLFHLIYLQPFII